MGNTIVKSGRGVGLLLIWFGVATSMVIFLVFVVLGPEGVNLGSWPNVVSPLVVGVSLALVTRGRRERAGGAERMLAEDARAPVVYLRPFGADGAEIAKRLSSRAHRAGRTLREDLRGAAGMRTAQDRPFVAVRNPAERLPLLGAARMYAADEDWRAAVGELIGRAAVVVLHAGKGDGFTWEVQHVIKHCAAARAISSMPLDARRKALSRQQRYDAFRRRFGHVFPRPLPEAIGYCQFAYFDADWTPRLLGERGAPLPDGEDERARALRRLAHEFKITWGPLWARMIVYSAAILGGLAGLDALLSSAG